MAVAKNLPLIFAAVIKITLEGSQAAAMLQARCRKACTTGCGNVSMENNDKRANVMITKKAITKNKKKTKKRVEKIKPISSELFVLLVLLCAIVNGLDRQKLATTTTKQMSDYK